MSNIAWDARDDIVVAGLLRRLGVTGIEVAPTKWRADPVASSAMERAEFRRTWEDRGLPIVAMQALLFGQPQLQLFGDRAQRRAMADYLRAIIDLGASLGASALVFGSPKNRARHGLAMSEALTIAAEFFDDMGRHAQERGTTLCIEANPPEYGCDFITTTAEAIALCRRVNSSGIRVNGDLGGMTLSADDVAATIGDAMPWLGHFHASEPQLAELGAALENASDHACAGAALRAAEYRGWVSIEMRDVGAGNSMAAIERAVAVAGAAYRST
jgi:D-psicose/D-tagatose/L-ribulose 3-epimerase